MYENDQFYSVGKTPTGIIGFRDGADGSAESFLRHYSWSTIKSEAVNNGLKAYFIDLHPIGRSIDYTDRKIPIVEIPDEFLAMPDYIHTFLTSINYTESGPFRSSELAFRASKRLFTWDHYIYCLPNDNWRHARDMELTRKILEKYFPLNTGDTGPAGGIIIRASGTQCTEVSPIDAGCCSWHDAGRLCEQFSHNGYTGWRLPAPAELMDYAHILRGRLRKRYNIYRTAETTLHWSSFQKSQFDYSPDKPSGDTAIAVVTQENEDYYLPLYYYPMGGTSGGYYKSEKGPWRGDEKKLPVTDWLPVRPVRDLRDFCFSVF